MLVAEKLTEAIIGCAIDVHKALGPGLLESAYEECLCCELGLRSIKYQRQVSIPLEYKGFNLDCSFRIDIIVEDTVVLELKAIEKILPIHKAQILTYMKLSGKSIGLILNFNEVSLKNGLTRLVL